MRNNLTLQFLRHPFTTGAIVSSSKTLALKMVSEIGIEEAGFIVELGPGTGAVTSAILEKINRKARFFAVELNPEIVQTFQVKFPETKIYNESAAKLPDLLEKENTGSADIIISGLPWASFPAALQDELLKSITSSMSEKSIFVTYAYMQGLLLPAGRRFRRILPEHFSDVETSRIVWKNLPPAFIYRCRKVKF